VKKYLLPQGGKFYKANLHCHTTISDGSMTPQEVKDHYMAHGYSIVAYTDHCVMIAHPELEDENFLPLTGFEMENISPGPERTPRKPHCHACYIALDKDNVTMPFYHPKHTWGDAKQYVDQIKYDERYGQFAREYTPESVNEAFRIAREASFFVTYNHPAWSVERYPQYSQYRGMHAMEIMNWSAWSGGHRDYNPHVYDDLLLLGNRIFAIATDDNHGLEDACGGYTMIKAEKLEYKTVTDALMAGNFYASWGPEIHELWYEDGQVHITCSPASRIIYNAGMFRPTIRKAKDGKLLTEAVFDISPNDPYFRITVMDEQGCCADTNAYFTDELTK